jgi:hypothetical protein
MTTSEISFSGCEVVVRGRAWSVPYPVRQAVLLDDRVLIVYDYMAGPTHSQFRNLEAFTLDGTWLWTAEHPTSNTAGAYVRITSESPLVVDSFVGFDCTLDPATGRLLARRFTK